MVLRAALSRQAGRLADAAPVLPLLGHRLVAGDDAADALRATSELVAAGLAVSLVRRDAVVRPPDAARDAYLDLLGALWDAELTPDAEVSVSLPALGLGSDREVVIRSAREICARASEAGTTVTLQVEEHHGTEALLDILAELRKDFPTTGVALLPCLRRTESDCRELAGTATRVRLCHGRRSAPESVAYPSRLEGMRSYVRCLNTLLSGGGYPMVATHDPTLVAIAEDRARWFDRTPDQFEFQLRYGLGLAEQRRLAADGYTVRVLVPYGVHWYDNLVEVLAERGENARLVVGERKGSCRTPWG